MHIICTWFHRKINRFWIRSKGIYSKNARKCYFNLLDFNMLVVKNKQQKGIQSQNNSVSVNFHLHLILPLSVFYSKSVEIHDFKSENTLSIATTDFSISFLKVSASQLHIYLLVFEC